MQNDIAALQLALDVFGKLLMLLCLPLNFCNGQNTIYQCSVHADLSQWLCQVHHNVLSKCSPGFLISLAGVAQVIRVHQDQRIACRALTSRVLELNVFARRFRPSVPSPRYVADLFPVINIASTTF